MIWWILVIIIVSIAVIIVIIVLYCSGFKKYDITNHAVTRSFKTKQIRSGNIRSNFFLYRNIYLNFNVSLK